MRVIYYFTAGWCNPCKTMRPIFEEIMKDEPYIGIQYIDADSYRDIVKAHKVSSVPTMILFEDGKELRRITGAKNKKQLMKFIYDINVVDDNG